MKKTIQLPFVEELAANLRLKSGLIQVILGPRQVGKTTGVLDFFKKWKGKSLYFSADEILTPQAQWIEEKWQLAQVDTDPCILVLDEIQKIPQWSEIIKKLWDQQKRNRKNQVQFVLLGSSSLQIQSGLHESLAGRFQLIRATHWSFSKSRQLLKKMNIEEFVRTGGYPGSYELLSKPRQWEKYIQDSIIETVIGKDILQLVRVNKPALFRQTFRLIMTFPAQEISYTKLLGQLQDKGNTDLVRHYIELFEGAFLVKALSKYSGNILRTRASSPKLLPLCGAIIDRDVFRTPEGYGRAFEAAVGSSLVNNDLEVFYWREGNAEVDFVTAIRGNTYGIEVKSGRKRSSKGLTEFLKQFPKAKPVYISEANIESFLEDPSSFFEKIG